MASNSTRHQREMAARQRVNEMRRQQKAAERRRRALFLGGVVVLIAALVGGLVLLAVSRGGESTVKIAGVKTYSEKQQHVTTPVTYPQTPPAGGPHNPTWLNCGVYDKPVPNENAVHDLEHGAVWITYRPDLPAKQVAKLKDIVGNKTYIDLSPYPDLPKPVVVSAWGKQLQLPNANDDRLTKFIQAYRQGPQAPEPGASCTGGVGTPTG